jgi:hypothetical protein
MHATRRSKDAIGLAILVLSARQRVSNRHLDDYNVRLRIPGFMAARGRPEPLMFTCESLLFCT